MTVNSENLVFAVHRTHDMLRICEDKLCGKHGLTAEQYAVLVAVKHLDSPVRPTDVAHWLTHSVNSVSMIADRMVKAGLLRRVRDRKDRRTVFLAATSKAETLLEPAILANRELAQGILAPLSYDDKQALNTLLETLQIGALAHSS